ncbi:MAG: TetR family transcriptional regulator [Mycobacterium sp.]
MATRRTETSRESRQLLIKAATELFAEHGFRRTTLADIADHCGISRGSIPWHFGNKEGLLQAVIDDMMKTTFGPDAPRARSIDEAVPWASDFIRRPDTRLLITLIAEAVEPHSPVHGFYADLHRALREWASQLTAGLTPPPRISRAALDAVVVGAVIGLHQQWRVDPTAINIDRSLAALTALLLASE